MGKMKEKFIEQINSQMGDEDYQYEQFKNSKELEELNEAHRQKYSDADVEYVLKVITQKYPGKLTESVINDFRSEFFNINSLRYEC